MFTKVDYFAQNKEVTFAENIDRAWAVYVDINKAEADRRLAQQFLIYAFNIKASEDINAVLLPLMEQRNIYKAQNPEYIPGLTPRYVQLPPDKRQLQPTAFSYFTTDPNVRTLFASGELLDVNANDKANESTQVSVRYFSAKQRAKYRVHIYQGRFYQSGKLFNTSDYEAHFKPTYAAFTLNANGELSVFKHLDVRDKIAHSSMNAGSPVVCAGELVINDGELITINTYSGHYEPSLFSIFRVLEYFVEKGINISQTKVQLFDDPRLTGLKLPVIPVAVTTNQRRNIGAEYEKRKFYEVSAVVFVNLVQTRLNQAMHRIQSDLQNYYLASLVTMLYDLKDWIIGSDLTEQREQLAEKVYAYAGELRTSLSDDSLANSNAVSEFIDKLQTVKQQNEALSQNHGKNPQSGRLQAKIDAFIQQAQSFIGMGIAALEDEIPKMKSTY